MAQTVHLDVDVELGLGEGRLQYRIAEPTTRNVPVRVPSPRLAGLVLSLTATLGTVLGVGAFAEAAAALAGTVSTQAAVPVLATRVVRFSEPKLSGFKRDGYVGRCRGRGGVGKEQVPVTETHLFDVRLDLGDDLSAELE